MMSGYPTSMSIPQVDGLSTRHPEIGASQFFESGFESLKKARSNLN